MAIISLNIPRRFDKKFERLCSVILVLRKKSKMEVVESFSHSRRDSCSTVTSSVAAELVHQHQLNSAQNNIGTEGSQTIVVGDVVHNFYAAEPNNSSNENSEHIASSTSEDLHVEKLDIGKLEKHGQSWRTLAKYSCITYALFILIIFLISTGLLTWFLYKFKFDPNSYLTPTEETTSEIPLNFFPREEWLNTKNLTSPIKNIYVAQTGDEIDSCHDRSNCAARVKYIRSLYPDSKDFPYNFMIGGDGSVFEGRGFGREYEHTSNSNGNSVNDAGISIAFIGTFHHNYPTHEQVEAFEEFIRFFTTTEGVIDKNHKVFGYDQLHKFENFSKAE